MEALWQGLLDILKVAIATLSAFFLGELKVQNDAINAGLKDEVKELKTDAKNTADVAALPDSQLDDELRDPPAGT